MLQNDRKITISAGNSRNATRWPLQTMYWSELVERLRVPTRGTETLDEYLKLTKAQQDNLKDVGGFVGGIVHNGGRRKAGSIDGRDVLTLDLDHIPAGGTDDVLRRVDGLGCGYCIYSTRKHSPAAPRLRVLLPLDRTVTADEYEPVARKAAELIGIEMCDPSTFEASRLMYWPSCCADSQYVFTYGDKPFLSADGVLTLYTQAGQDWHDVNVWPQVPGVTDNHKRLAAKQGDPTAKPGVVGAFCRTYNIYSAMDKFLPGVYVPVDNIPDRYTYAAGSTTGGAIVYDNGTFLYSHHATDPCNGRLVNAFDLVRLHLFGDKDDEAQPGTPTNRLPSYTEMCALAVSDPDVAALLAAERYQKATKDFSGTEAEAASDWMKLLEPNGNGGFAKTLKNYKIIINNDPNFKGKIRMNLFSGRIDVVGELPWTRATNSPLWTDTDTTELRAYMEPIIGRASKNDVADAVDACAGEHAYHPVRDYLNSLTWDGTPRLDTLFIDYLGAADTPYIRAVTRKSFTAAVARVMTPGIKYDTMVVIIGTQGRYKSTILAKMGGAWFSDSLRNFGTKDSMETIQGTWINEIAEMQAMNNSEIDAVKAFLSKQSDYYRAAYGHYAAEHLRQCVFFGTTNTHDCLRDTTGGRRFWPVDIDLQPRKKDVFRDLDAERDQLWAEAVVRWRLGEPLHLPPELEAEAGLVQEDHRERHPWEGKIEEFIAKPVPADWLKWDENRRSMYWGGGIHFDGELVQRKRICAVEIWCECLGKTQGDFQQRYARMINQLLEKMPGWIRIGVREAGLPYGKQCCFERRDAAKD